MLAEPTAEPYGTMLIQAGCLRLSRSEFVGLKWSDINLGCCNPQRATRRSDLPRRETQDAGTAQGYAACTKRGSQCVSGVRARYTQRTQTAFSLSV